ncbi:hypothetical protein ACLB1R_20825 [Escherichia coli]
MFIIQRAFVKFDVGVTSCTKAFQRLLVHAFYQQKDVAPSPARPLPFTQSCLFASLCADLRPPFNISKNNIAADERLRRDVEEISRKGNSWMNMLV